MKGRVVIGSWDLLELNRNTEQMEEEWMIQQVGSSHIFKYEMKGPWLRRVPIRKREKPGRTRVRHEGENRTELKVSILAHSLPRCVMTIRSLCPRRNNWRIFSKEIELIVGEELRQPVWELALKKKECPALYFCSFFRRPVYCLLIFKWSPPINKPLSDMQGFQWACFCLILNFE